MSWLMSMALMRKLILICCRGTTETWFKLVMEFVMTKDKVVNCKENKRTWWWRVK